MKSKKVLSLFDGISCGRVALERANIKVDKYYASEIDPNVIKVTQHNYEDTIQLGNVCDYESWDISEIDLLIGGSPCQNFSTLGNRKGLQGDKSGLFYKYAEVLKRYKPTYFLLENNANMPLDAKEEISDILGVQPIMIDSNLVSAQNRKRLYWTNIAGVKQPIDRNIKLKDILTNDREEIILVPFVEKKLNMIIEKYGYIPDMFNPYNCAEIKDKSPCLTAQGNSQTKSSSVIIHRDGKYSMLNAVEWERLQTLPDNYTSILNESNRKKAIGNAWNVDTIVEILKYMD